MRVQITARHCQISDGLRTRAETGVKGLQRFNPAVHGADVIFEEAGLAHRVEIVLAVDHSDPVVAGAEVKGPRRALDLALHRVRRMLRKQREKARDHRAPPLSDALSGS